MIRSLTGDGVPPPRCPDCDKPIPLPNCSDCIHKGESHLAGDALTWCERFNGPCTLARSNQHVCGWLARGFESKGPKPGY